MAPFIPELPKTTQFTIEIKLDMDNSTEFESPCIIYMLNEAMDHYRSLGMEILLLQVDEELLQGKFLCSFNMSEH